MGLYFRDDLEFHLGDDLCVSTSDYECIWIEIHRKFRNIVCAVIYRHPNGNLDNFTDYFYEVIDKISNESKLCSLLGDSNLNLLNFQSHNTTGDFVNTLASYYFQPHIIKPTRITYHSATLIDNIFFNSLEHEVITGNLLCDLSEHLPNFLIINDLLYSAHKGATYKRDYARLSEESLVAEVQSINWDAVFANDQDINSIFESFHKKITEVIDNHVPLRKLSKKECKLQVKPWITNGIRVPIDKKNKIYKEYLKYKTDYHLSIFRHYRNHLKHLLLVSKKQYYNNFFFRNNYNIKETWSGIKQLINVKVKSFNTSHAVQMGNLELTDKQSAANAFNNYFLSVGPGLAAKIPSVSTTFEKYMNTTLSNSMVLFPVSVKEIEQEIDNLNISKSTGPFSIPVKVFKILRSFLSAPLSYVINYSFSNGVVPDKFKLARVIPIYKKGNKSILPNYRLISLILVFSKIMEKLMYNRLIDFLKKNNVFYSD